ncbi:unnamed protein product, partial [Rotaria magnacalcarata]
MSSNGSPDQKQNYKQHTHQHANSFDNTHSQRQHMKNFNNDDYFTYEDQSDDYDDKTYYKN